MKDTNKKLKVSQGLPDWKAYVDFMNNVVVYGLKDAMISSLRAMACQFDPIYLLSNNLPALMEIQMDLVDRRVMFLPEVGFKGTISQNLSANEAGKSNPQDAVTGGGSPLESGINNIVLGWINGMLGLSSAFKRLDSGEGTYLREILEAPEVQAQRSRVIRYLNNMEVHSYILKFFLLHFFKLNKLFSKIEKCQQTTWPISQI